MNQAKTIIERLMKLHTEIDGMASNEVAAPWTYLEELNREIAAIASDIEQAELDALSDDVFGPDLEGEFYAQD